MPELSFRVPALLAVYTHLESENWTRRERSRMNYVEGTAAAIEAASTRILGDVDRTRQALRRYVLALGKPERGGVTTDREEFAVDVEEELFELFAKPNDSAATVTFVDASLRAALAERFEPFAIGFWGVRGDDRPRLQLVCGGIEFEDGSLKSKLTIALAGAGAVLTLGIAAAQTPAAQEQWTRHQVRQEIRIDYGHERCFTTATFEVDYNSVLDAMTPELNFHNASGDQRARAVCLTQLGLSLAGHPVGPIDGKDGHRTWQELTDYAKSKGYNDPKDPAVFRELTKDMHKGARDLVGK
jgi:hypothetical protein